jgi:hypothetical protein
MSVKNATVLIKVKKRPKSPILKKVVSGQLPISLTANRRLAANC